MKLTKFSIGLTLMFCLSLTTLTQVEAQENQEVFVAYDQTTSESCDYITGIYTSYKLGGSFILNKQIDSTLNRLVILYELESVIYVVDLKNIYKKGGDWKRADCQVVMLKHNADIRTFEAEIEINTTEGRINVFTGP